jgi:Arc/MetJ-type ribon-helix-helix transcriptional regulator
MARLTVELSEEQTRFLEEQVAAGKGPTPEFILDQAILLLRMEDPEYVAWLRAEAEIGMEDVRAGRVREADDAFFEELREHVRQRSALHGTLDR